MVIPRWPCYATNISAKTNPRKDLNELAFSIMQRAMGEVALVAPTKAQEDGRKGGLTDGKARAAKLPPERRTEITKKAAESRWKR